MSILDFLLGKPLPSSDERAEQIGPSKGIPIFGLDALGSAAYGPEAAMTLLIPLGVAGLTYLFPISLTIIILLFIVYGSYRQTIKAYPNGGGSYTVARENLGTFAGLLAGAALLIDYALDAAVGISAGVGALTSAIPSLHPRTLTLALAALLLLTIVNLRGVREAGGVFLLPTYLFLACMAIAIVIGLTRVATAGGHPHPVIPPPPAPAATAAFSLWLLLKAYAAGCTALTGVEAVSNGVQAFRDDRVQNAQRTLGIIIAALALLLAGIAWLAKAYGIVAVAPDSPHYQSLLSLLLAAIVGRSWFYYLSIGAIVALLVLSANTAFADFPRVCRFIASDGFLPTAFVNRGRRLVYSEGIVVLAVLTAALLIGFGGITDRLIPLFAVGAFLAFTMSQAGMVAHWLRERGPRWQISLALNLLGAVSTGLSVLIIVIAKFTEGAWITILAIPTLLFTMYAVRAHYRKIRREISLHTPIEFPSQPPPILVITIQFWTRVNRDALLAAMQISSDVRVVHVREEDQKSDFCDRWEEFVARPTAAAGRPVPRLIQLHSPYRFVLTPIVNLVVTLAAENPDRRVITVIPELMERRWFHWLLHTQRATLLKSRLLMEGNDRISVLNVPWYLKGE